MNRDITFCANQDCPHRECLRYHRNAPKDKVCSWFGVVPREDGSCDCYLKIEKGGE